MSVLIRGVTMPKDCDACQFSSINDCKLWMIMDVGKIHPECPLVELPEKHGRLVEFVDVATTTDEDTGTETVNLGEAFAAYFKMRESKPVIEAEGEG